MPHFEQRMADAFWAVDASSLCARRTQPIARSSGVTEAAMPPLAVVTVATCDDDDDVLILAGDVRLTLTQTATYDRSRALTILNRIKPTLHHYHRPVPLLVILLSLIRRHRRNIAT